MIGFVLAVNMDNATFVCRILAISNDNDRRLQPSLQIPEQMNSVSRQRNSITLNCLYCHLWEEGLGERKLKVNSVHRMNTETVSQYSCSVTGPICATLFVASKFRLTL